MTASRATPQATDAEPDVRSPCVSICVLNAEQVCLGCGRTRDEVGRWSLASSNEKRDICRSAEARMAELV